MWGIGSGFGILTTMENSKKMSLDEFWLVAGTIKNPKQMDLSLFLLAQTNKLIIVLFKTEWIWVASKLQRSKNRVRYLFTKVKVCLVCVSEAIKKTLQMPGLRYQPTRQMKYCFLKSWKHRMVQDHKLQKSRLFISWIQICNWCVIHIINKLQKNKRSPVRLFRANTRIKWL